MKKSVLIISLLISVLLISSLLCITTYAEDTIKGDINGDSVVDINDAIYLLRHTMMPSRYPVSQQADIDGTGDVSIEDAIYLLRHTMMPTRYPIMDDVHVHSLTQHSSLDPTCNNQGNIEYWHCASCNKYYSDAEGNNEISFEETLRAALGHTEVTDAAIAATCTATGLTQGKHCSVCNTVLVEQTTIPALGHTEVTDAAVAATCTATGLTQGKHCSVCNTVLVAQTTVAALGHTEVTDAAVAATCTATGLTQGKHCSVCNTVLVEQTTIPALGHTEVTDAAVAATCTATGLTQGKHCSVCNTVLVAQTTVAALGHTEVTDAAVAATCTATGLTQGKHCSVCNTVLVAQTTIPALGHTEVTDAAVAETCTATGLTQGKHCSVCNTVLVAQTTIPAFGHTEVTDAAVAATCTATGLTQGKHCARCLEVIVEQQIIAATGHSYDSGVIVTEATCISQGIIRFACTVNNCNDSYTETYNLTIYTATEIANQAVKYVGEITTYDKNGNALSIGTGFIISSDGKLITNYHVIEDAYYADIVIDNSRYTIVSVLAYDADIDLAVLKINATNLTVAKVCNKPVNVGETIYAIGSSRGLANTFSQGIITYADRVVDGVSHVQHDASITNGNSGGPLINVYGEVIGINTWGLLESQNLNFAVASKELDNITYLGAPISIQELYEQNHSAYETLVNWVIQNYNYTGDDYIEYRYRDNGERYSIHSLVYFIETKRISLVYYYVFDNGDARYVSLTLSEDTTAYRYYAAYTDGDDLNKENVTQGYIYPSTFTRYTPIEYYSFEGDYWTESSLLNTYQGGIVYSLQWFAVFLDAFELNFTLSDFGFDVFDATEKPQTPREILVEAICNLGEYDSSYGWYSIEETYNYSTYQVSYCMRYDVDSDVAFMSCVVAFDNGPRWYVFLSLDSLSDGMLYSCTLEEYDSLDYIEINETVGYLNPIGFTQNSELTFISYSGSDDQMSDILGSYSIVVSWLLDWFDYYLNDNSINVTLEDLGF